MQVLTVRIDRVFDVVHGTQNDSNQTQFGLEINGRKAYGLALAGQCELHDGMIVSAVLERENDWQTLLAMRCHASGGIYRKPIAESAIGPMAIWIGCFLASCLLAALIEIPPLGYVLIAMFLIWTLIRVISRLAGRRRGIDDLLAQAPPLR